MPCIAAKHTQLEEEKEKKGKNQSSHIMTSKETTQEKKMVLTDLFSLEMITYPPHYRVLISYVSLCVSKAL